MKAVLVLVFMIISLSLYASPEWGDDVLIYDGPSKGMAIDYDNTGTLYAWVHVYNSSGMDTMKLYSSPDSGRSWYLRKNNLFDVRAFDIDVVNGNYSSYLFCYVVDNNILRVIRYNLPNLTYETNSMIDYSNNDKHWVVARNISNVTGYVIRVAYSVDVQGNSDSTAVWYRESTDSGITWGDSVIIASNDDGDWDEIFDFAYGMHLGMGYFYFCGSRKSTFDNYALCWSSNLNFPHPLIIWDIQGIDYRYPNIAVSRSISDSAKICIVYGRKDITGDWCIHAVTSKNGGNSFTQQTIFDSTNFDDNYPVVDITSNALYSDTCFILAFRTSFSFFSNGIRVMESSDFPNFNIDHGYINEHNVMAYSYHHGLNPFHLSKASVAWTGYSYSMGTLNAYFDRTDFTTGIEESITDDQIENQIEIRNIVNQRLLNITFNLEIGQNIKIEIFDLGGRQLTTIANQQFNSGDHQINWDYFLLPSGTYFLRCTSNSSQSTHKFQIIN